LNLFISDNLNKAHTDHLAMADLPDSEAIHRSNFIQHQLSIPSIRTEIVRDALIATEKELIEHAITGTKTLDPFGTPQISF
jgi:hypothetical protein